MNWMQLGTSESPVVIIFCMFVYDISYCMQLTYTLHRNKEVATFVTDTK